MSSNLANGQQLVTIPAGNDVPWYYFQINLSGVQYTLAFRFNVRMNRWILDVGDSQNVAILSSLPILIERDLTERFKGLPKVPVGTFSASDDARQKAEATRYSFGTDHTLWYLDPLAVT